MYQLTNVLSDPDMSHWRLEALLLYPRWFSHALLLDRFDCSNPIKWKYKSGPASLKRINSELLVCLDSLRSSCWPSRDACCSRLRTCGRLWVMKRCRAAFCHSGTSAPPLRPSKSSSHWATPSPAEVRSTSKGLSRCCRGEGGQGSTGWRVSVRIFRLEGGRGFYLPSESQDEGLQRFDSLQQLLSRLGAELLNPCLWEQSRIFKFCTGHKKGQKWYLHSSETLRTGLCSEREPLIGWSQGQNAHSCRWTPANFFQHIQRQTAICVHARHHGDVIIQIWTWTSNPFLTVTDVCTVGTAGGCLPVL